MEEFTFPCIPQIQRPTHQLPFSTTSSSLWLLASSPPPQTASPSFRRSFSSTEGATAAALRRSILPPSPSLSDCGGGGGHRRPPLDDEERMDMLWEDFNEELRAPRWSVGFERRTPKLDRRPTLRMSPALGALKSACGGARLRHKKPSLGVMLRVLKKLFVVQGARNNNTTTTTTTTSKKKFMK